MSKEDRFNLFAAHALSALISKFPILDREGKLGPAEDVSKLKSEIAESAWEYAQWMVYHSPKAHAWLENNTTVIPEN